MPGDPAQKIIWILKEATKRRLREAGMSTERLGPLMTLASGVYEALHKKLAMEIYEFSEEELEATD